MDNMLIGVFVLVVFIIVVLVKTAVVVEQQYEYVIERLGKYRTTLEAGFHILIPFFDKVAYKRSLKEQSIDIPAQTCITADNVSMEIDGCLYLQVVNSRLSAYGIDNYHYAVAQLAQTSLRSAIGKISLDNTFEARENLNQQVVDALDEASQNWGVKVLRYEIKDIQPPKSVLEAMEKQMRAEREKRAEIAKSEGERQSTINRAEGDRAEPVDQKGPAQPVARIVERARRRRRRLHRRGHSEGVRGPPKGSFRGISLRAEEARARAHPA